MALAEAPSTVFVACISPRRSQPSQNFALRSGRSSSRETILQLLLRVRSRYADRRKLRSRRACAHCTHDRRRLLHSLNECLAGAAFEIVGDADVDEPCDDQGWSTCRRSSFDASWHARRVTRHGVPRPSLRFARDDRVHTLRFCSPSSSRNRKPAKIRSMIVSLEIVSASAS